MLTKVAIILLCLVVLFGFGRRPRSGSPASRKTTNILLALVAFLLVLTLITNLIR